MNDLSLKRKDSAIEFKYLDINDDFCVKHSENNENENENGNNIESPEINKESLINKD